MADSVKTLPLGGVSGSFTAPASDFTPRAPSGIGNLDYFPSKYGTNVSEASVPSGSISPLSAIGVGGNLFSTFMNMHSQDEINRQQYRMFKEQMDFNRIEAEKARNFQANFNSEVNQVKRLREAGLNPALVFGGSQSVGSSQAQSPDAPHFQAPRLNNELGSSIINGALGGADLLTKTEYNRAFVDLLKEQSRKFGVDSEAQRIINGLARMTFDDNVSKTRLECASLMQQANMYASQSALNMANKLFTDNETSLLLERLHISYQQLQNALEIATVNSAAHVKSAQIGASASMYGSDQYVKATGMNNKTALTMNFRDNLQHSLDRMVGKQNSKALINLWDKQARWTELQTSIAPIRLMFDASNMLFNNFKSAGQGLAAFAKF